MHGSISELIQMVYSAPHYEEGWDHFFRELLTHTNTKSGVFSIQGGTEDELQPQVFAGFEPEDLQDWVAHYAPIDPYMSKLDTLRFNCFYRGDDVYPRREYLSSEVFNDWSRRQDTYYATGSYLTTADSTSKVHIALQRGKSQGPHSDDELQLLNSLIPHIQQAVSLGGMLTSLDDAQQSQLDTLRYAAFLCDKDSRVIKMNAAAEALCIKRSLVSVVSRELTFKGEANSLLRETVRESATEAGSLLRSKTIRLGQGSAMQIVRVVPWWSQTRNLLGSKDLVLVVIRPVVGEPTWEKVDLQTVFELTPRETDVAYLLAKGTSPVATSEHLNVSESTVRSHIKAILNKTQCTSLQEFVAILNSLESPFI